MLSGTPWLGDQARAIGTNAFAARILCERHNHALSPLDTCAEQFFQAVRHDQIALATDGDAERDTDTFTLVSGPALELWLLKLFWGGAVSASFARDGTATSGLRSSVDPAELAAILWRGAPWPPGWGLHGRAHPVDPHGTPDSVGIVSWVGPDETVWGGVVELGAIHLFLALGEPDQSAIPRPGAIVLRRADSRGEKVFALAWPEAGHQPIEYTRVS